MTVRQARYSAVLLGLVAGAASPAGGDTKLGKWLVEEGRSYALSSQARGTEGDARIVLSLMQAATQVAPRLPEGYLWQYEAAALLGEMEIAREALQFYTMYRVTDVTRRLLWIEVMASEFQTVEERIEFLDRILEKSTSTGALGRSDIHRRKAEMLYGQGNVEDADENIRDALTLYPGNIAALQLHDEFHQTVPDEQAEAFYWLLALSENPASWESSINLARELDCLGLRAEAREWHLHALRLLEHAGADGASLADVLLDTARSCMSDGKHDEARRLCLQAITSSPESVAAHLLLSVLCGLGGEGDEDTTCGETHKWLAERHEQLAAGLAERPEPTAAAALSWYHGHVLGDYDQAVEYGDRAVMLSPDDPVAQSCAGYAYLGAGRPERAAELLAAPAKADAQAAVGLGRAYLAMGRVDEGIQLLGEVASSCACGEAYDAAVAALTESGGEPPVLPDTARLSEALRRLDRTKLEYAFNPDRHLGFGVELVGRADNATVPWEFRFAMVNRSQFDITLGPGKMLDPRASISIELRGEVDAVFEDYSTVSLGDRPVLRAGQYMEAYRVVDTGRLREFLWRTAQVDYEVRVRAILNPIIDEEGLLVRSPFGLPAQEFGFHRPGLVATPGNLDRLFSASRSEDPLARGPAAEKLVALWAEQQAYEKSPQGYGLRPIPVELVREAVVERWKDEDQGVRLRVLGALRLVSLDNSEISSLASMLHHEDPLTRMEVVLLLADQHGASFLPVVAGMADGDPDPMVRQLCAGFRGNWAGLESGAR